MALIRSRRGLISAIAKELHITQGAVSMWERVPAERLPLVEKISGIPRFLLRPDICPPPPIPGAAKQRRRRRGRRELNGC